MEVSDVVRRVRDAAGDMAVLQFSNATLTDWINDGVRECVVENTLLQARASTTTVVDQFEYTLPEDILRIHSVLVDGLKLEVLTLQEWEERNTGEAGALTVTGAVGVCYVYAGVLTLWPTPDSEVSLIINYSRIPEGIGYDAGPPETWVPVDLGIPSAFHTRIVTYCLAQVALQDDDFVKYQSLMQQFTTGVLDLKHLKDQQDDLYSFISVANRDLGELY